MRLASILAPVALVVSVAHCGGATTPALGSQGSPETGDGGGPAAHFPTPRSCGSSVGQPVDLVGSTGGWQKPPPCTSSADCVAAPTCDCGGTYTGTCKSAQCDFDQCTTDADCPAGSGCVCYGSTHAAGNVCMPVQCRVDADCGAFGTCSESMSEAGPFYGVEGRYCRTAQDQCKTDADCGSGGGCVYLHAVGYWGCSYSHAAG